MFNVKGKDLPVIIMRSNIRHPHPSDYFNPRPFGAEDDNKEEEEEEEEEEFTINEDKTHFYYQFPKHEFTSSRFYDSAILDWVLKHSTLSHSISFRELTISSQKSEIYSNQFLSLKKMKFLLLLKSSQSVDEDNVSRYERVIHHWKRIGNRYSLSGDVLFSYLFYSNSPQHRHQNHPILQTIIDTYDVDVEKDLPLVIAFNPWSNRKFRSKDQITLNVDFEEEIRRDLEDSDDNDLNEEEIDKNDLFSFVRNVMTGQEEIYIKSESIPKNSLEEGGGYVRKIVGETLLSTVSRNDIDVLLLVYAPLDYNSRNFLSTFDLLGRAVQHEERILVGKINGLTNDIPSIWNIKTYATLLWFPAKDKESNKRNHRNGLEAIPLPLHHLNPFTIAAAREESGEIKRNTGFPSNSQNDQNTISLYELYLFLQRETSFPVETLKIATVEQIGSLLSDEDEVKKKYEAFERNLLRNEGRMYYENEWIDWFVGEVSFDGKRYHIVVLGLLLLGWVLLLGYQLFKLIFSASTVHVIKKKVASSINEEASSEDSEESSNEENDSNEDDSVENQEEEEELEKTAEKELRDVSEVVRSLTDVS
jgi:hypothetical protein